MANQPMYLSYSADASVVPYTDAQIEAAKLIRYNPGFVNGYKDNYTKQIAVPLWSTGTDAEIVALIAKADAGEIDLSEYWSIGDERDISLGAIANSGTGWTVGESQAAQTQTFVLMDSNHFTLTSATSGGRTKDNFVVGMKNCMNTKGRMNGTNSNSGGWNACGRREWCNNGFKTYGIPSTLISIFKQFETVSVRTYNATSTIISTDYFSLFAEKEITGSRTQSNFYEAESLSSINYYETSAHRIKYSNSSASYWWERSTYYGDSARFCCISTSGAVTYGNASGNQGIAPFGCI